MHVLNQFGGTANVFPIDQVDAAFERSNRYATAKPKRHYIVLDPSSGGASSADAFTMAAFGWVDFSDDRFIRNSDGSFKCTPWGERIEWPDHKPTPSVLKFVEIDSVPGGFFGRVGSDDIAKRIKKMSQRYDTRAVISDQREQLFLEGTLKREDLRLTAYPWTAASKPRAIEIVRRWFADGLIALPRHDQMRRELLSFQETVTAAGQFTYGARRSGHDDFVSLLVTAAHAELDADIYQSPIAPQRTYARLK
jgi:hypothetical protein